MNISEQSFRELLERYHNGTATPEEQELLDRFFASYQRDASDPLPNLADRALRDEMLRQIHVRTGAGGKRRKSSIAWLAIAASVSIFVLLWFFIGKVAVTDQFSAQTEPVVEVMTHSGEKSVVRLTDGTIVHLNGNTRFSYPAEFNTRTREVRLDGEGYFEVANDGKPFVVHTAGIQTEVLGTSFNIRSRPEQNVEVTLVEGRVNIVTLTGQSLEIEPNQRAVVDMTSDRISMAEVNVIRFTSWRHNVLVFEQTMLEDAAAEIETWYGVKIDIVNAGLKQCLITAKYQDEPLGNVLSSLQFLLNLEIKRLDATHYSLGGKGCN